MCGPSSQNQNLQTKCERTKDQKTNIWIVSGHDFSEAGLPKENSRCLLATIKAIVSSSHVTGGHPGLWALDVLLFPGSKCTLKHKAVQSNVYLPDQWRTDQWCWKARTTERTFLPNSYPKHGVHVHQVSWQGDSSHMLLTHDCYRMPSPWFS